METSESDDLMPRPSPKPSQFEEISVRPEVPELSLVFDCSSAASNRINSSVTRQINNTQQPSASLLDTNYFLPRLDHHYLSISSPRSPVPSSPAHTALKTPLRLDDRGVLAAKKVSFSPHGSKPDTNGLELNGVESQQHKNEGTTSHCVHDTGPVIGPQQYHHSSKYTSDEKKTCLCSSCSNDSFDCSWDHSTSIQRALKNLERKMNTKVSYDDLQKTELKIENILLKHKCKYDKLGENCVSKDEFNRIIKSYESQVNLLQLRVEELTQKLSLCSSHYINSSCNHEIKKCNCAEDVVLRKSPPKQILNTVSCASRNCCPSHRTPNENFIANEKNYVNGDAAISTNNHPQFNTQLARSDTHELQRVKNCHQNCCRDQENFNSVDHCDPLRNKNPSIEKQVMIQTMNTHSPSEDYNQMPPSGYKSSSNQVLTHQHHSSQPQNLPRDHQQQLSEKNEEQLLSTEKNIRLDWTFYNNIVEDVKNLMQKNTKPSDPNAETMDFIKQATIEHLQKMGINMDNRNPNERHSPSDHHNNKFIATNSAPSPDLSFRLNSVAMKYVSETPPDLEYHNKKSPPNDNSFRSNCNNVSIATLQYMERYQLLPNGEQRYGGNSAGFSKYEQNAGQDHRHKSYKPSQNNDRSFIY